MIAKAAASRRRPRVPRPRGRRRPAAKDGARKHVVAGAQRARLGEQARSRPDQRRPTASGATTTSSRSSTGAGANVDVSSCPKVKRPADVWFVDAAHQLEPSCADRRPHRHRGADRGGRGAGQRRGDRRVRPAAGGADPRRRRPVGRQGRARRELGGTTGYPGDIWHYARNRMIVAARAAGLDAIDGPYADFAQPRRLPSRVPPGRHAGRRRQVGDPSRARSSSPTRCSRRPPKEMAQATAVIDAVREAEAPEPARRRQRPMSTPPPLASSRPSSIERRRSASTYWASRWPPA